MTERAFKLGWATLLTAFALSAKGATTETEAIYWQMLHGLPESAFMNAVTICLEECEFFPTIAKLREAANRKPLTTGALKQMQLDPPMTKEQGIKALRDLISKLPDPKVRQEALDPVKPQEKSSGKFAQFNKEYVVMKVPCLGCGAMCILPFANGGEQCCICEECNRIEGHDWET